jgi:hypothetical protein
VGRLSASVVRISPADLVAYIESRRFAAISLTHAGWPNCSARTRRGGPTHWTPAHRLRPSGTAVLVSSRLPVARRPRGEEQVWTPEYQPMTGAGIQTCSLAPSRARE